MKRQQSGFTLIEMVIVIILLGILAAVAVPQLANVNGAARLGVQDGTIGALKSAWAIAYAVNRTPPTTAQLVAQMVDPACNQTATTITCPGVRLADNSADIVFAVAVNGANQIISPANITFPATR